MSISNIIDNVVLPYEALNVYSINTKYLTVENAPTIVPDAANLAILNNIAADSTNNTAYTIPVGNTQFLSLDSVGATEPTTYISGNFIENGSAAGQIQLNFLKSGIYEINVNISNLLNNSTFTTPPALISLSVNLYLNTNVVAQSIYGTLISSNIVSKSLYFSPLIITKILQIQSGDYISVQLFNPSGLTLYYAPAKGYGTSPSLNGTNYDCITINKIG